MIAVWGAERPWTRASGLVSSWWDNQPTRSAPLQQGATGSDNAWLSAKHPVAHDRPPADGFPGLLRQLVGAFPQSRPAGGPRRPVRELHDAEPNLRAVKSSSVDRPVSARGGYPRERVPPRGNFYDLCAEIDHVIGSVLDALDRCGFSDNTVIAFNSDHGTLLGEHGLRQNRMLYGPVVRVPFILSAPGMLPGGRAVSDPVELVDFFPTLMALAGIPVPENVQGRNLGPQIEGEVEIPGRPTFSEIDYSRAVPEAIRRHGNHRVMIRHSRWELVCSLDDAGFGEDGALFGLEAAPHELKNLYHDHGHRDLVEGLKVRIAKWRDETT